MNHTKSWPVLLILSITVSFFSCEINDSGKKDRESKGGIALGGDLTLAISETEIDLDPLMMNNATATFIGNQVHGTLLKSSPGFEEPTPCIAERWELDETGTILFFHIRKGMTFQRQECVDQPIEITAADVVKSLTRICSPEAKGGIFESFRGQIKGGQAYFNGTSKTVLGLQVLDDYRLKITLNKPNQAFLYLLTEPATGVVRLCDDGKIIASGPFVLISQESEFSLERNENYELKDQFGNQLPYLDNVFFKQFATTSDELDGFFAGEIDLVTNIYEEPVKKIMDQHIPDFAGNNAKYVIQRFDELASYDLYTIRIACVNGYEIDHLGRPDLTRTTKRLQD
jgi:ABC-type transport system substrate-binding protein